jgi:hypothetical protein
MRKPGNHDASEPRPARTIALRGGIGIMSPITYSNSESAGQGKRGNLPGPQKPGTGGTRITG